MPTYTLTIEPKAAAPTATRRQRPPPKGRRFEATLLAYVTADAYWEAGGAGSENIRPVWAAFAQTEAAMTPFVRNLQDGQRAAVTPAVDDLAWSQTPQAYLELPKGRGEGKYRYLTLRLKGVATDVVQVVTAYLPPLVKLDPGMIDRDRVSFLALTAHAWIAAMLDPLSAAGAVPGAGVLATAPTDLSAAPGAIPTWVGATPAARAAEWARVVAHLDALGRLGPSRRQGWQTFTRDDLLPLLPQAVHVLTLLDRHTASPLRTTFPFMLQAYLAGLECGIFTLAHPVTPSRYRGRPGAAGDGWDWARHDPTFTAYNAAAAGLSPPVGCRCTQADLDAFLDRELGLYFRTQAAIAAQHPALSAEPDLDAVAARQVA